MTLINFLPHTPFKKKNVLTFLIGTVISMGKGKKLISLLTYTQCAPSVFNLYQKFHGHFCFCDLDIGKIVQNQLKTPSVNRVPTIFKFPIVKMTEKRQQTENRKTFSKENLFYDCGCYGTVLTDGFFN